jgi:hypothetical protein
VAGWWSTGLDWHLNFLGNDSDKKENYIHDEIESRLNLRSVCYD